MQRKLWTLAGGALAIVAALFGQTKPVMARQLLNGKTIVVSGIPGCDCNQKVTECHCLMGSS